MKPQVLLLPLECQDHESCNNTYNQLIYANTKDETQFSLTIKFEPVIKCENDMGNNHRAGDQFISRTPTDHIMCAGSGNTSVNVGVVHIKVEPQDECEINKSGSDTEPQSGNSHRSCVIASHNSDISTDNINVCDRDVFDRDVRLLTDSNSNGNLQAENKVSCDASTIGKYSRLCRNTKEYPGKEQLCKCTTCRKTFSTPTNCKRLQRIHTGDKPYKCSTCAKSFSHIGDCNRHKRIHTGEKHYTCPTCGKSFRLLGNCKTHQRTHTGEKPYTCPTCGKSFTQHGTCKKHQRIHTGEEHYTCPTCGKSFRLLGNCKTHQRTHTGEKPYTCPTCGKSFTQHGTCKKHQRIHTGEKHYTCPTCGKSFRLLGNCK